MKNAGIIHSFYKGFFFYLPKDKTNGILEVLIPHLAKDKNIYKHFFIFFDNQFDCRFRLFIYSEHTSEEIFQSLNVFISPYFDSNQVLIPQKQFFQTYQPFSIIPIAFIDNEDEIITSSNSIDLTINFLENITKVINESANRFNWEDENQKLEFVLELLLSSLAFFDISSKQLLIYYKESLKYKPKLNTYLENTYGKMIEENKESVLIFRKSLMTAEKANDLLNVFWKNNQMRSFKKMLRLIFKVLNITSEQQSYCLFVLHKTSEDLAN